jgi:ferrochelatase
MDRETGILLVNLGTPLSPQPNDVYRYLIEFLTDERIIDLPWWKRQLLVRGLIVPFRYRQSAKSYAAIWTEEGSPLLVYSKKVQSALQQALGDSHLVELAMRYQEPSLQKGIATLMEARVRHLIVLPLFPQYASATTGSVHQRVQEILSRYTVIPKVTLVDQYATHPALIAAFATVAKRHLVQEYDHYLFSFHGLPKKHIRKADPSGRCLRGSCCERLCRENHSCYSAQCHATARALIAELKLPSEQTSVCFQSRLGKDPWLEPYTSATLKQLAQQGKKNVLVFCPAFVCDCLETTFEIGVEYAEEFAHLGGRLQLVEGLNADASWVEALRQIVQEQRGCIA